MVQDTNGDVAGRCTPLHKTYQMGQVDVKVLRGIDLEILRGQLTVIVGASGAGKSTLLNIIGGIDRPTSGEVWVDGENLAAMNDRQLTEYRRRKIGTFRRPGTSITANVAWPISGWISKRCRSPNWASWKT